PSGGARAQPLRCCGAKTWPTSTSCLRRYRALIDAARLCTTLVARFGAGIGMAVPVSQMWAVASYVLNQRIARRERYATVLMLEALLRCNLACDGCGKIQYPPHVRKKEMEVADALRAVEECGAPVISIPGGEPMMYSKIGELVRELVKRKKYIYLCTNAILLKQRIEEGVFEPSKFLTFNI